MTRVRLKSTTYFKDGKKVSVDENPDSFSFTVNTQPEPTVITRKIGNFPAAIQVGFTAHGAVQTIGDAAAGETTAAGVVAALNSRIEQLEQDTWRSGGGGGSGSPLRMLVAEAMVNLDKEPLTAITDMEQALTVVDSWVEGKLQDVAKGTEIAAEIAGIKLKRAKEALKSKQAAAKGAGTDSLQDLLA